MRNVVVGAIAATLTVASLASAEDTSMSEQRAVAARAQGLPHTLVEVGVGILALPFTEVCPTSPDDCSFGEVSLGFGIHNLYQFGAFGFGAGIIWATTLRSDVARGAEELERDHARRYFQFEAVFRYSFVQSEDVDAWAGATVGGVSVLDAWTVKYDREPPSDTKFVGPEALSIGTEGVSASVGAGVSWIFVDNLSLGGSLRYGNWILPSEPETSPLGDVASLSGRIDFFDLGVNIAYRLAL